MVDPVQKYGQQPDCEHPTNEWNSFVDWLKR